MYKQLIYWKDRHKNLTSNEKQLKRLICQEASLKISPWDAASCLQGCLKKQYGSRNFFQLTQIMYYLCYFFNQYSCFCIQLQTLQCRDSPKHRTELVFRVQLLKSSVNLNGYCYLEWVAEFHLKKLNVKKNILFGQYFGGVSPTMSKGNFSEEIVISHYYIPRGWQC